jgi:hypothetical protein
VTSLRNAVLQPIAVLATWAVVLFAAMAVVSHRLGKSPAT